MPIFVIKGFKLHNYQKITFLGSRNEFESSVINSEIYVFDGCNISYSGYLDRIKI